MTVYLDGRIERRQKVYCPSCRRLGDASLWSGGSHYSFSCLCGLLVGGSCDQMPDDFERMAMSVSDITARVDGELSDLRQQIATLTADRDQLVRRNDELIIERDAFKFAAAELCVSNDGERRAVLKAEIRKMLEEIGHE